MISALVEARLGSRSRRRRAVLTGLGIGLASAMLAAALVVGDGLGGGFGRAAAAAHLADVIVRFDPQRADRVAQRIEQLPDLRTFSLRRELTGVELDANGHDATNGNVEEVVALGPRGYEIVGGRDVSGRWGEIVVDRGVAAAWDMRLCETLAVGGRSRSGSSGSRRSPTASPTPSPYPRSISPRPQRAWARIPGSTKLRSGYAIPATWTRFWCRRARPATASRGCDSSRERACACCSTRQRES